jgi:hypothetical protein
MTDHRMKINPLSSFENKQRSFSTISYMVFFTYFTIYGVIQTCTSGPISDNSVHFLMSSNERGDNKFLYHREKMFHELNH